MWRHYVYVHRRSDDGRVFYVGKGTERKRHARIRHERANATSKRSAWWRRVVAKHGLSVEIVASFVDDQASQEFEKALIARLGRATLVNLTDGGDGSAGRHVSDELREKRRRNSSGPRSEAWVAAIRRSRVGGGNRGVVKQGDKLPESWRMNIAAAKVGDKNPMSGRTGGRHHNSKTVVDTRSGVTYPSVTIAASALGVKMKTLYNQLTGFRQNTTSLRLA